MTPARLTARFLAGFVDYLVLWAVQLSFGAVLSGVSNAFGLFAWSLIYFSAGNSEVLGGRTLGKRAFGLQVVRYKAGTKNSEKELLSLSQSLLRFCWGFGLAIALTELPPILFESSSFVGPLALLNAHMLFVLFWTLLNLGSILCTREHLALHDSLSASMVIDAKNTEISERQKVNLSIDKRVLLAAGLALFMWLPEIIVDSKAKKLLEHKYQLAARHQIEIFLISADKNEINLEYITETSDAIEQRDCLLFDISGDSRFLSDNSKESCSVEKPLKILDSQAKTLYLRLHRLLRKSAKLGRMPSETLEWTIKTKDALITEGIENPWKAEFGRTTKVEK